MGLFHWPNCTMKSQKLQPLNDSKGGKKVPWRVKKVRSLILADSFQRMGWEKKANAVRFCSSSMSFLRDVETGRKVLHRADFCRERMCPMCKWRRSLKVFHEVSRVMDGAEESCPDAVPIFLTLTVRNCSGDKLSDTLDMIFAGWHKMVNHRRFKRSILGGFRALEVTYSQKNDTFHPHIHAIMMVNKAYFKRDNKDYMTTTDWVKLWRTSLQLDYDPVCDIRKVDGSKGKHKAVAEVAKYAVKDGDYVLADKEVMDRVVQVFYLGLRKRRLYAFWGILKLIAKDLKADSLENGDLVHVDDERIRDDVATVIEVYRWSLGACNYHMEDVYAPPPAPGPRGSARHRLSHPHFG